MTAATAAGAPARPPRARHLRPAGLGRLLRLELRRSPMPWMVPPLAALFGFGTYRLSMKNPPFWNVRGTLLQLAVLYLGPLLAGAAAWTGSREGRRAITDVVGATALPRWAGRLTSWAAMTCWAETIYLLGVALVYGVTAHQASWGGPLWWPVAVGAVGVAASGAIGFAAGALVPGRFTAPLVAVVVFLALGGGALALQDDARYAQIWPLNVQGPFPPDSYGIFYPYLPDLAIAQVMFLAGLAAAVLGLLGLPAAAGGRWLRGAAAALTAAGLAAAGTAAGLAGTARLEAHGMVIPALHDAASDRPVAYTPVCSQSAIPVCLHPAYRYVMADVTAALRPVLGEVAGLPGAPTRITQVAVTGVRQEPGNGIRFEGPLIGGSPPVLYLPLAGLSLPGEGNATAAQFTGQLRARAGPAILDTVIGGGGQGPSGGAAQRGQPGPVRLAPGTAAQIAIEAALARLAGVPPGDGARSAAPAAARRFAALPPAARHAWLVGHLAALRAGRVTLSEIP